MGTLESKEQLSANRKSPAANKKGAEEVVSSLREVLRGLGIVLPSLRVDPAGYCNEPPVHLVDLGRINFETARKLTEVLRGKANEPRTTDDSGDVDG
jgi:hypothetical protein